MVLIYCLCVGSIPENLTAIRTIIAFAIDSNLFTGTIPAGLANMTYLVKLAIQFNQLTGVLSINFS